MVNGVQHGMTATVTGERPKEARRYRAKPCGKCGSLYVYVYNSPESVRYEKCMDCGQTRTTAKPL